MITELEKQFFSTFEIKPTIKECNWQCQKPSKLIYQCIDNKDCSYCIDYPQITDRHLLELICILAKATDDRWGEAYKVYVYNHEDLKELILDDCYFYRKQIKHQVQQLFEE